MTHWGAIVWAYVCVGCSIVASSGGNRIAASVSLLGPCLWLLLLLVEVRSEMPEDEA